MDIFLCPLCGETLKEKLSNTDIVVGRIDLLEMHCPAKFEWEIAYGSLIKTHYGFNKVSEPLEMFYIPPFNVVNHHKQSISRIYKLHEQETSLPEVGKMIQKSWRFITQVPLIKLDIESKMLERINLLLKFL